MKSIIENLGICKIKVENMNKQEKLLICKLDFLCPREKVYFNQEIYYEFFKELETTEIGSEFYLAVIRIDSQDYTRIYRKN